MLHPSCTFASSALITWALFAAACAHAAEEFLWPGGFRAWYIGYSPYVERTMTASFLLSFNAAVLIAAAAAALFFDSPSMRFLWLALASALGINGLWHLQATLRSRSYSPGVVTGTLLLVPLAIWGSASLVSCGWVTPHNALAAVAYGGAYWILSEARKLLRRSRRTASRSRLSIVR